MKKKSIWFFIGLLWSVFAHAQKPYITATDPLLPKKIAADYEKTRGFIRDDKPKKALECLQKILRDSPSFIDAQLLLADTYYTLQSYVEARTAMEKAVGIDSLYFPKGFFMLGNYCEKDKKYIDAARYFERYAALATMQAQKTPATETILERIAKAKLLAEHCRFRAFGYAHPVPFTAKNMGDAVNSTAAEYSPSLSIDGNTLIFTRQLNGQEDFYSSSKDTTGDWGKARDLGTPINTADNEGAQSLSADGKTLIYTACNRKDGAGSCDLLFSEYKNGAWTTPVFIDRTINGSTWESQPTLSANGQWLIFSTNRKDGKNGGKNLYQTRRTPTGTWSAPTPLTELNTPYDETTPFLHPDGKTLYFSSTGHPGFGDCDIFVSRLSETGSWGNPENLGYPINTEKVESGLIVSRDGKTAIFAAEFKDTRGKLDLYSFELPLSLRPAAVTYLKATVKDAVTGKKLVGVSASLKNVSNSAAVAETKTDEKGEFLLCLPVGVNYSLAVAEKKYAFYSDNFNLTEAASLDKPYELRINLQPLQAAQPSGTQPTKPTDSNHAIVLRNVFFNTNSADLKPESRDELLRLRDMLTDSPTLHIQLNGHTDNVGEAVRNQILSENRAAAVRTFLVQNGIQASRLTAQGFGETQPIDSNNTEQGRKNNRRTEFMIVP